MEPTDEHLLQYVLCKDDLLAFISHTHCAPIMIRLAWHDSGKYDKTKSQWPQCGGAKAPIVSEPGIRFGADSSLAKAVDFLKPFKASYPAVSWADLIQMSSACAIEATGGPVIPMRYGRADAPGASACPAAMSRGAVADARLADAMPPFGCDAPDALTQLSNIFYHMGVDHEAIVALCGAHAFGRAFKERRGAEENGCSDASGTTCTKSARPPRHDARAGVGVVGGKPWAPNGLTFDNSYFQYLKRSDTADALWLPMDKALRNDPRFNPFVGRFADSQPAFFEAYARAHKKLSELGSTFEGEGFILPASFRACGGKKLANCFSFVTMCCSL